MLWWGCFTFIAEFLFVNFVSCNAEIDSVNEDKKSLIVFETLFKLKRSKQIEAVKTILDFKYEQQYKMINTLLEKAFEDMISHKVIIENSDYIPGHHLPINETVKEALYQILDHTAMYGELQLKLPDIVDRIMKKHLDWTIIIQWALGFANSTGLLDVKTTELINLVAQDMNLVDRSPTFINPYRLEEVKQVSENVPITPQKKKKIKNTKGPRISKPVHTEF